MKNVKKIIPALLLLFSGYTSAATISMDTAFTTANVNDVFTINVIGTDFLSNVDGGGINISFDSSVVNILSVSIDESVWDFGGFGINTGSIDNINGTLDGVMVNTFANVKGNFVIATIEMQAIAVGDSLLSLSEYVLNPWASGGSLINPDFIDASVNVTTVSAVPVPAAVWLFGSGLIGLAGFARRKKSA